MLNMGEDELICDLAETYHILNWRELPPSLVATLSCGLREDSRIKKKMGGQMIALNEMLFALMVDSLNILIWQKTKDGAKNRNRPESLFKKLTGQDKKQKDELEMFTSVEEFEAWHKSKMRK